jgi:hypothetical protein
MSSSSGVSFEYALNRIKSGDSCLRRAWKHGKWIRLKVATAESMSYIALEYLDGRSAPWTPTRCDLLENDWVTYR